MIRVLIVDDQEMIRAGLRVIIDAHPDLQVVAESGDALAAIRLLGDTDVDVVLMDIRMPVMDGIEATRAIRDHFAVMSGETDTGGYPRIVALTANAFAEDAKAAHDADMNAHLSKPLDFNKLKNILARIKKNGSVSL